MAMAEWRKVTFSLSDGFQLAPDHEEKKRLVEVIRGVCIEQARMSPVRVMMYVTTVPNERTVCPSPQFGSPHRSKPYRQSIGG